jgi:hypothetical protein
MRSPCGLHALTIQTASTQHYLGPSKRCRSPNKHTQRARWDGRRADVCPPLSRERSVPLATFPSAALLVQPIARSPCTLVTYGPPVGRQRASQRGTVPAEASSWGADGRRSHHRSVYYRAIDQKPLGYPGTCANTPTCDDKARVFCQACCCRTVLMRNTFVSE